MRSFAAAAVLIALSTPAVAQVPNLGFPIGNEKGLSPEEREQQAAQEKAYKESLKKIPNQASSKDPWGSARAAEQNNLAPSKPKPAATSKKSSGN